MVTMFITPEKIGPFYLCHVCERRLATSEVVAHMSSAEHNRAYLVSACLHSQSRCHFL